MYAQVIDGRIVATRNRPPEAARRLDTEEWVLGLRKAPKEVQESCGWFLVVNTASPAADPLTKLSSTTELVDGVPTTVWTETPKTEAELAQEAEEDDRKVKSASVAQAVDWLRQREAAAAGVTVTSGNAVNVLQQTVNQLGLFFGHFADYLESQGIKTPPPPPEEPLP